MTKLRVAKSELTFISFFKDFWTFCHPHDLLTWFPSVSSSKHVTTSQGSGRSTSPDFLKNFYINLPSHCWSVVWCFQFFFVKLKTRTYDFCFWIFAPLFSNLNDRQKTLSKSRTNTGFSRLRPVSWNSDFLKNFFVNLPSHYLSVVTLRCCKCFLVRFSPIVVVSQQQLKNCFLFICFIFLNSQYLGH